VAQLVNACGFFETSHDDPYSVAVLAEALRSLGARSARGEARPSWADFVGLSTEPLWTSESGTDGLPPPLEDVELVPFLEEASDDFGGDSDDAEVQPALLLLKEAATFSSEDEQIAEYREACCPSPLALAQPEGLPVPACHFIPPLVGLLPL
jgi:hypothetical protein